MATTVEMKTKIDVKKRVMLAWMMCAPEKHETVGKNDITCKLGSFSLGWQLTMFSKNSVTGMKSKVTNKGTI